MVLSIWLYLILYNCLIDCSSQLCGTVSSDVEDSLRTDIPHVYVHVDRDHEALGHLNNARYTRVTVWYIGGIQRRSRTKQGVNRFLAQEYVIAVFPVESVFFMI